MQVVLRIVPEVVKKVLSVQFRRPPQELRGRDGAMPHVLGVYQAVLE